MKNPLKIQLTLLIKQNKLFLRNLRNKMNKRNLKLKIQLFNKNKKRNQFSKTKFLQTIQLKLIKKKLMKMIIRILIKILMKSKIINKFNKIKVKVNQSMIINKPNLIKKIKKKHRVCVWRQYKIFIPILIKIKSQSLINLIDENHLIIMIPKLGWRSHALVILIYFLKFV